MKLSNAWDNIKTTATEKFEKIKDEIGKAWENVKKDASDKWEGIKTTLSDWWVKVRDTAKDKFEEVRKKVSEAWDNVKTDAPKKWEEIKSTLVTAWEGVRDKAKDKFEEVRGKVKEAWDNIKSDLPGKWEEIKTTIQQKWDSIVSAAKTWGSDICKNIADGISSGIRWVTNAAKDVANSIKDFLGFSEPKKGPLSNFHTYMPDMLELMSDGIRDNAHIATGAASELAKSIADSFNKPYTLGNVSIGKMPDISTYRIPAIAKGEVIPANREFTEVVNREYRDGEASTSDIENAVARALRTAGMSGGGSRQPIILQVGEREFGRLVVDLGDAEYQRRGVRMTEARA